MSKQENINLKSGQVLLVTIMVLATVITIVLSATFKANTDTKISQLEQESQKALAAAESGIEAALKSSSGSVAIGSLGTGLSGFTGSASVVTTPNKKTFVSPIVAKDGQYTFYLANYSNTGGPTFAAPLNGDLTIYYGTTAGGCSNNNIALEMTVIYGNSPSYNVRKFIADYKDYMNSNTSDISSSVGKTIEGTAFQCSATLPGNISATFANAKVMLIRVLSGSTRLGFETIAGPNLPSQGKVVSAQATSTATGVSKRVELFQSNPQFPADFFVTSF